MHTLIRMRPPKSFDRPGLANPKFLKFFPPFLRVPYIAKYRKIVSGRVFFHRFFLIFCGYCVFTLIQCIALIMVLLYSYTIFIAKCFMNNFNSFLRLKNERIYFSERIKYVGRTIILTMESILISYTSVLYSWSFSQGSNIIVFTNVLLHSYTIFQLDHWRVLSNNKVKPGKRRKNLKMGEGKAKLHLKSVRRASAGTMTVAVNAFIYSFFIELFFPPWSLIFCEKDLETS